MQRILILGAGTAGTMMANKLRKALDKKAWKITIVDQSDIHYYQPGFLFIPFGIYKKDDVIKSKSSYLASSIDFIISDIDRIEGKEHKVYLEGDKILEYDYLIVATGAKTFPEETPGLADKLWYKEIFDFYTIEGAVALHDYFENWGGGKLVVAITDVPLKCPVAPLEFVFLADAFFTKKGIRDKVEITYATPMSGAFTKPVATKMLSKLLEEKNIKIVPDFYIERIDNDKKMLVSYDEKQISFDVLTIVPLNKGDEMIERSGLGDDMNYIPTDKETLQSKQFENIFVIGDASNIPASKAGSVAHFAAEILFENLMDRIAGKPMKAKFDGHANCYIETGFGKASLIDFNYDTEPLPGVYPYPVVGPFGLLKNTRLNHLGKMVFRWIYWNILIKGRTLPVTSHMSMAGKRKSGVS
jgi:sulfide:quinone oxidoreductase